MDELFDQRLSRGLKWNWSFENWPTRNNTFLLIFSAKFESGRIKNFLPSIIYFRREKNESCFQKVFEVSRTAKGLTCGIHVSAIYTCRKFGRRVSWKRERERLAYTRVNQHWQRRNWYEIISFANKWNIPFSLFINLKNICSMIYRLRMFVLLLLPCHEKHDASTFFLARSKSRYLKNWHNWQRSNKHKVPVISS